MSTSSAAAAAAAPSDASSSQESLIFREEYIILPQFTQIKLDDIKLREKQNQNNQILENAGLVILQARRDMIESLDVDVAEELNRKFKANNNYALTDYMLKPFKEIESCSLATSNLLVINSKNTGVPVCDTMPTLSILRIGQQPKEEIIKPNEIFPRGMILEPNEQPVEQQLLNQASRWVTNTPLLIIIVNKILHNIVGGQSVRSRNDKYDSDLSRLCLSLLIDLVASRNLLEIALFFKKSRIPPGGAYKDTCDNFVVNLLKVCKYTQLYQDDDNTQDVVKQKKLTFNKNKIYRLLYTFGHIALQCDSPGDMVKVIANINIDIWLKWLNVRGATSVYAHKFRKEVNRCILLPKIELNKIFDTLSQQNIQSPLSPPGSNENRFASHVRTAGTGAGTEERAEMIDSSIKRSELRTRRAAKRKLEEEEEEVQMEEEEEEEEERGGEGEGDAVATKAAKTKEGTSPGVKVAAALGGSALVGAGAVGLSHMISSTSQLVIVQASSSAALGGASGVGMGMGAGASAAAAAASVSGGGAAATGGFITSISGTLTAAASYVSVGGILAVIPLAIGAVQTLRYLSDTTIYARTRNYIRDKEISGRTTPSNIIVNKLGKLTFQSTVFSDRSPVSSTPIPTFPSSPSASHTSPKTPTRVVPYLHPRAFTPIQDVQTECAHTKPMHTTLKLKDAPETSDESSRYSPFPSLSKPGPGIKPATVTYIVETFRSDRYAGQIGCGIYIHRFLNSIDKSEVSNALLRPVVIRGPVYDFINSLLQSPATPSLFFRPGDTHPQTPESSPSGSPTPRRSPHHVPGLLRHGRRASAADILAFREAVSLTSPHKGESRAAELHQSLLGRRISSDSIGVEGFGAGMGMGLGAGLGQLQLPLPALQESRGISESSGSFLPLSDAVTLQHQQLQMIRQQRQQLQHQQEQLELAIQQQLQEKEEQQQQKKKKKSQ